VQFRAPIFLLSRQIAEATFQFVVAIRRTSMSFGWPLYEKWTLLGRPSI
jgi:hypothetical protein